MRLLQSLVVVSSGPPVPPRPLASPRTLPLHLRAAARGHCCNPGRKSQNGSEKVRKRFRIRFQAAMTAIYAFGPFRLDVVAGILFRGAEPVSAPLPCFRSLWREGGTRSLRIG